jgi:tetratricopeptide (TPR) repeat protein
MGRRLGEATLVEQAVRTFSQADAKVDLASAAHALAQINARSGAKAAVTLERYERAIAALDEVKADYELAVAHAECGRLQQQTGDVERARINFARALALFEATGASVERENLQKDLRQFHPSDGAVLRPL